MRSLVQAQSLQQPSFTPMSPGFLKRNCGCDKSVGVSEKESQFQSQQQHRQRPSVWPPAFSKMSPVLHEALPSLSPKTQSRLKIGQPNDKYEQEADRIADQVIQMPGPSLPRQIGTEEEKEATLQATPIAGQISPLIQRQVDSEEEEEEDATLQTKRSSNPSINATPAIQSGAQAIQQSIGQPLPSNVRTFMEPRFGQDFSGVHIHTTGQAPQLAHSLNARAFTVGNHIAFAQGAFNPHTSGGQSLIAHELVHTLQQGKGASSHNTLQRAPDNTNARPTCTQSEEEETELNRARRPLIHSILTGWLRKVENKNLKVGPLRRLRARRARRICLLSLCGDSDFSLTDNALIQKLQAFDLATDKGKAYGVCSRLGNVSAPTDTATPQEDAEETEETICPDFKMPPASQGKTLWVLGDFKKPAVWNNQHREAKAMVGDHTWSPSTEDFRAAAGGKGEVIGSVKALADKIKAQGKKGVSELNLVGHGNDSYLALSGKIFPPGEEIIDEYGDEDERPISTARVNFNETGLVNGYALSVDGAAGMDLKPYFAPGAVINLYACNTATLSVLPAGIAKQLCTVVYRSDDTISYCPHINNKNPKKLKIVSRNKVYVEGTGTETSSSTTRTCQNSQKDGFEALKLRQVKPGALTQKRRKQPISLDFDDLSSL
ncbi:eCIS core domain-containing protein [Adonisia turfae]|uniref:DUF4157 domain-containing protein n=1 Tax=Adonisia turfae CCMR0081 TaxID=2292702 RepID=A0A6M0RJ54_9CYAN|nr:DUF4157 domain-containing protein [Adonisia turfae]NEZ56226.1 DUF4157 domain-containing protein [Adonisia turfae CCMR0081]